MVEATSIPIIQKAVKVICNMSDDSKTQELVRLREKALHDEASALKQAKAEGREEGRAEGKAAIIKKMKDSGMTDEQINAISSSD